MSFSLTPGDRQLLLIGGALLVVLLGSALLLGPGTDRQEIPSSYSAGSQGAKAAFLLLKAAGYVVDRWEQPPADLADPAATTLIVAEPQQSPTMAERRALQAFLEAGGRVIATGQSGALLIGRLTAPDPVAGLTWTRARALTPSAITRAAPEITIAPRAYWAGEGFALPLYGSEGEPLVVRIDVGRGDMLWWASATPLTNVGLREPGNLEFFLACVGPPGTRRLLWDEYFHGRRRSLAGTVMRSPVKWVFGQLALVALVVLVTYSRRSGPIVIPAVMSRLSPVEFVQTQGALYQRAGAATVAVDVAYQRFCYGVARRLGFVGRASADDLERAAADRLQGDRAAFAATLRACEAARHDPGLGARTALELVKKLDHWEDVLARPKPRPRAS